MFSVKLHSKSIFRAFCYFFQLLNFPIAKISVKDWMDVQNLMWRIGKTALMKRIENFKKDGVEKRVIQKAARCLRPYDEDMAHATSAGCGTFYVWVNTQNIFC